MTEKTVAKILLTLAASEASDRELAAFGEWAQDSSNDLVHAVSALRKLASSLPVRPQRESRDDPAVADTAKVREATANRVSGLLREAAGLSASAAASAIAQRLVVSRPDLVLAPFTGKEGLVRWVLRLMKDIPPSEIMQAAAQVRNEALHQQAGDWPLKTE